MYKWKTDTTLLKLPMWVLGFRLYNNTFCVSSFAYVLHWLLLLTLRVGGATYVVRAFVVSTITQFCKYTCVYALLDSASYKLLAKYRQVIHIIRYCCLCVALCIIVANCSVTLTFKADSSMQNTCVYLHMEQGKPEVNIEVMQQCNLRASVVGKYKLH